MKSNEGAFLSGCTLLLMLQTVLLMLLLTALMLLQTVLMLLLLLLQLTPLQLLLQLLLLSNSLSVLKRELFSSLFYCVNIAKHTHKKQHSELKHCLKSTNLPIIDQP